MWDEEEVEAEFEEGGGTSEESHDSEFLSPDSKAKAIMESKLPESEKHAYMVRLGLVDIEIEKGIPFKIYAKIKQIPKHLHEAMMVWPKAKIIKLASREQWDKIFKDF